MKSKYFTVEVKPRIPNVAAGQHAAFADGDILFDWFAFDIPKGPAKLIGVSSDIRPKGDSGATPNEFPYELFFAKSRNNGTDPTSLGTVNSAVTVPFFLPNQILTFVEVVAGDFADHLDSVAFAHTVPLAGTIFAGEAKPEQGTHVGFDRYYVAGMAGGSLDFSSILKINAGTLDGSSFTTDEIAATTTADTAVSKALGTIKSMTATNITLETTTENAILNNDFIYNIAPLTIRLHFEK